MTKHNFYFKRTIEHIHRVHLNAVSLITNYSDVLDISVDDCRHFMLEVLNHDRSKFWPTQFYPYVELTHFYAQKRLGIDYDYPEGVEDKVNKAIESHYLAENHHPEAFKKNIGQWGKFQALECACDLQAMAQEFNEGSCRKYFEEVWVPKQHKFFYDDFNWSEVHHWMKEAIKCFEKDLENETR